MLHVALATLLIYAVARLARSVPVSDRVRNRVREVVGGPVGGRWAPVAAGVVTALLVWWVSGSLHRLPVIHDETAYLLQAAIFAHGRWTAPAPPIPEFFEQLHVLVSPVLASKYPPGWSLALVPGIWLGLPGVVPVVLAGLTGAFVVALARRVAGRWVGLVTWLVWIAGYPTVYRRATYLSETLTSLAWLVACWWLLDWRARRRTRSLVVVAVAIAVIAITRPLTAVALLIPIAVVVLRTSVRPAGPAVRRWRPLLAAFAAGTAIVAILPLWNARTTGDWRVSPLSVYTRAYLPFDRPGFGVATPRATRPLPPDLLDVGQLFYTWHVDHEPAALPRLLVDRLTNIATDIWQSWTVALVPFALVGLLALTGAGWFALASFASVVLCYLSYAHPTAYTVYYLEVEPVLAYLTAVGLVATIAAAADGVPIAEWRRGIVHAGGRATVVLAAVAVVIAWWARPVLRAEREMAAIEVGYWTAFDAVLARIHDARSVVFVHYGPGHNPNMSLVQNVPDGAAAPRWIAYDLGAANGRLLALAPGRTPYLFDEDRWALYRLETPSSRPGADTTR